MSLPDYAGLTREDPNPVKRWLQARRLADALRALPRRLRPAVVIDYGAGDGELARRLADRFPGARVIAFEPAPGFAEAARARLGGRGEVTEDETALPTGAADLVVCTEVFEHLPPEEERGALDQIARTLAPGGLLLVGVPVETGPPALLKGAFRAARRQGAEDAHWPAIREAAAGRAPSARGMTEIAPGRRYHPSHLGFDHRALRRRLEGRFDFVGERRSPFAAAPVWAASEVYWLLRKLIKMGPKSP